jgi:hypothetical protein
MNDSFTILEKIELHASTVSLRSDGIIHFYIKESVNLSVIDAKEMVAAAGEIGKGKKFPILISSDKYTLVDKEARDFAASEAGNAYTVAGGIVVKSLAQKLLGNAYLKVNKPLTPTALFETEEAAIKWLKKFI